MSGAFESVTERTLTEPAETQAWFDSAKRFGKIGSDCDCLMVHATAVHALRCGTHPVRMFVANVRDCDWKPLSEANDIEPARKRINALRGPPSTGFATEFRKPEPLLNDDE